MWVSKKGCRRLREMLDKCVVGVFYYAWRFRVDELAKGLCSEYASEAWRTGFAAGCAAVFGVVIVVHLLMRVFNGTWENLDGRRKKESKNEETHV